VKDYAAALLLLSVLALIRTTDRLLQRGRAYQAMTRRSRWMLSVLASGDGEGATDADQADQDIPAEADRELSGGTSATA